MDVVELGERRLSAYADRKETRACSAAASVHPLIHQPARPHTNLHVRRSARPPNRSPPPASQTHHLPCRCCCRPPTCLQGRNVNGQLGTGGTQDSNVPVEILALSVGSINLDAFTQEARPGGWQRAGKGRSRGWGRTGRWECGRRTSQNAWRSAHAASQLLFPCPHALPFALAMPLPPPPVGVQGVAPSDRYAVVPDSAPPSNEAGGTLQPSSAAAVPEPNKRQKV